MPHGAPGLAIAPSRRERFPVHRIGRGDDAPAAARHETTEPRPEAIVTPPAAAGSAPAPIVEPEPAKMAVEPPPEPVPVVSREPATEVPPIKAPEPVRKRPAVKKKVAPAITKTAPVTPPPVTTPPPEKTEKVDCNPPYYFQGAKKIFKPQCL